MQKRDRSSYFSEDTIVAACTALGGAVVIVRLSGPDSLKTLSAVTLGWVPQPEDARKLFKKKIFDPQLKQVLDEALVVYFPKGASLTGEDVVEIHQHGGRYQVTRLLEVFLAHGLRQALPGEFSFRAVKNGRMSLTEAEAVVDLIGATNDQAISLAIDKMSGLQHVQITEIGNRLRNLCAKSELGIDFSDQNVDELSLIELKKQAKQAIVQLDQIRSTYQRGKKIQDGIRASFVGLPNAGKSSLFNRIIGEDRSIVTSIPGTTRDVVRETLTLRNQQGQAFSLNLEDTAGLRKTQDQVEQIGVERSLVSARNAELIFLVVDSTDTSQHMEILRFLSESPEMEKKVVGVLNKVDLLDVEQISSRLAALKKEFPNVQWTRVSSVNGAGLEDLIERVCERCNEQTQKKPGEILITRLDHLQAVENAISDLKRAIDASEEDLFASDVRQSLFSLEPMIGKTTTDDILGKIFSEFCIGK